MKVKMTIFRLMAALLLVTAAMSAFAGCSKEKLSNEENPFIISSTVFDGVFNPFFSTSAADSTIVAATQLGMLNSDKDGNMVAGEEIASVALDYLVETTDERADKTDDEDFENWYTDYTFVLKNGVKFADGKELTIKDVLFTFYVYLDPNYTGSTTMYSSKIRGLNTYRYQTADIYEQENFQKRFNESADARINEILNWAYDYSDAEPSGEVAEDIETMKGLFRQELESDWSIASGEIETYKEYKDAATGANVSEQWQAFFIIEGWANINEQTKTVENWGFNTNNLAGLDGDALRDACINPVFNDMVENPVMQTLKVNVAKIVQYYQTATTLRQALAADEQTEYFEENKTPEGELQYKSIEGITTDRVTELKKNDETVVKAYPEAHDVLKIRLDGVDPKAIYNFSTYISPLHYYSRSELVAAADPATHNYGVVHGSKEFMDGLAANQLPMGAGAYQPEFYDKAEFSKNNIARLIRNDHFLLGTPKLRYLNFKVINPNQTFEAVATGQVHFADPNAEKETIDLLNSEYEDELDYATVNNLGYGYIGVSARYIPDIGVRKAIMTTFDSSLTLNFYSNDLASLIHRPQSLNSWAYPTGAEPYYPYDSTGAEAQRLIEEAGWSKNPSSGIYEKQNKQNVMEQLKFTFTLAGETENHPAAATFNKSKEILERIGCKVTITRDPQALAKLSSGLLTVWAAAWSSTIDPDMYQVYHEDSTATSVKNWGYPEMLGPDGNPYEQTIIKELSEIIEDARMTDDRQIRKKNYADALDLVMDLAVEFPTYQRDNLFVWDAGVLDGNSLAHGSDLTPYHGPIDDIWEVSFQA